MLRSLGWASGPRPSNATSRHCASSLTTPTPTPTGGEALAQQGKQAEAIDHYQRALRLKPDFAEAHTSLGLALAQEGKMIEAMEHFQQAFRIKPSQAQSALFNALPGLGTGKPDAAPSPKNQKAE